MSFGPTTANSLLLCHPDFIKRQDGVTFEDLIARDVTCSIGPFIALGDPDDYLPSPGAAKVYSPDDRWQRTASDFIHRAAAIIVLEGASKGLEWELSYIRQHASPTRVFILTLRRDFRKKGLFASKSARESIWLDFMELLRAAGFPRIEDPGPGSVVAFSDSWEPVVALRGTQSIASYVDAILASIGTSNYSGEQETYSRLPHDQHDDESVMCGKALAIVTCPRCKMRVVPMWDGACPSCHMNGVVGGEAEECPWCEKWISRTDDDRCPACKRPI